MNPEAAIPEPEDRLAFAEAALRGSSVPDGPSEDLIARTRRAIRDAEARPSFTPDSRRRRMIATLKLAAAAVLTVGVGGLSYLATNHRAEATTFTEMARKLQDAHTLSYQYTVSVPGQEKPTTGREFYKDPGLTRAETDPPTASVVVIDTTTGKMLSMDPARKTAFIQDWNLAADMKKQLQDRAAATAKHLKSLAAKDGKAIGKKKIGDVEAEGFRVEDQGTTWTVWVDPVKKLPLLMETTYRLGDRDVPATLSEFRIDPPLDDVLFRMDPPAGYALHKVDVPLATGEDALINLLRTYAEASGGSFPSKPDDPKAFQKQFPQEKWKGPDDPKMIRLVQSMAASVVFLQFELKNAYGYAPDEVKLGDADKVLLWYRSKNSKKYRAIFGDLHAEDVEADRLPEKPKF